MRKLKCFFKESPPKWIAHIVAQSFQNRNKAQEEKKVSQILIVITQLLIIASIFMINKRLDEMPKLLAWECSEATERQRRITEFFERKYRDALIRIKVYENALATEADYKGEKDAETVQ